MKPATDALAPSQIRGGLLAGRIAMAAFLTIVIGREGRGILMGQLQGPRVTGVAIALGVLSIAWLIFWLRLAGGPDRWLNGAAFLLILATSVALVELNPGSGIYPMYYSAIAAGAAYQWRAGVPLAGLVVVASVVTWTAAGYDWTLQVPVIVALLGGTAVVVRRYVAAYVELQLARESLRRLAGAEARADLARDLHDRLGQQLSALVLQGELLHMDVAASGDEEKEQRAAALVKTARDALQAMRDVVVNERGPRLAAEFEVARQLLQASGISCAIEASAEPLPTVVDQVLAWAVREGTSNILRHSGATDCTITVHRDGSDFVVELADNGRGNGGRSLGNGLRGLEERLRVVGGALTITPAQPRGLRLRAAVPDGVGR